MCYIRYDWPAKWNKLTNGRSSTFSSSRESYNSSVSLHTAIGHLFNVTNRLTTKRHTTGELIALWLTLAYSNTIISTAHDTSHTFWLPVGSCFYSRTNVTEHLHLKWFLSSKQLYHTIEHQVIAYDSLALSISTKFVHKDPTPFNEQRQSRN